MHTCVDVINEIREKQLTRGIRYLAVLGFFALMASLSRALSVGWQNIMYVHIILYLLILGTAMCNRFLPFLVKALIIIAITFILGTAGLIAWGLPGYGISLLFAFCILSTILLGIQAGILSAILSIATIGIIGAGVINGVITFDFNVPVYLNSISSWLTGIFMMIITAGIIVITMATFHNQLVELIKTLDTQKQKLEETNKELKKSMDERNKLEAGLERAKKMELVGTVAGGVAHDLNNVLAASISYPELLLMEVPRTSPLREVMEIIKNSGLKAAAMVQDLLTLARRGVPVEEVLNLNHIVSECIISPELERIRMYHPGVDLEVCLEENLWNIPGSPFHLMKTITNLVSNAAEAMPEGGKIIIKTQNLEIHEATYIYEAIAPGSYSVLTISDTGIGISEEDKENIFEPFYTKKVMGKSGTGLGMAVVWNTVKDHKGFINVDSIEGIGTTFSLYFPMTSKALAQPESKLPIKEYTGKGEAILVVDDVEEQRVIASKILTMLGYSVTTVSSGEEAVEYCKNHFCDLVILDMIMPPGMDGCSTYKEMLKLRPGQKAILVSGYAETERVKEAQKLGARTYIKKPFLMEKVGLAVRAELDRIKIGNNN
jgi:signal transduction histidine kinase/CheY-like chemotaxis protein